MPSDKGETQLKTCVNEACDRKVQSRGMCSSHYSVWHRKINGRKKHTKTCGFCGHSFITTSTVSKFCTESCSKRDHYGWSRSKEVVLAHVEPRATTAPETIVPPLRKRWFACVCRVCGTNFIDKAPYTHCGDECRQVTRRAGLHAHRVRQGKFSVTDAKRSAIYERDNWECKICGEETARVYTHGDPFSPTLDHIIPQSTQTLPDHSEGNLRLAHSLCNSIRGDGTHAEDRAIRNRARTAILAITAQ